MRLMNCIDFMTIYIKFYHFNCDLSSDFRSVSIMLISSIIEENAYMKGKFCEFSASQNWKETTFIRTNRIHQYNDFD